MEPGVASFGLAFAAGGLSVLSPCVLPLLPILFGTAVAAHRLGPLALATGLALSFSLLGLLAASLGPAFGLDQRLFQWLGAVLFIAFGVLLLSERLQARFAVAASGVSQAGQSLAARLPVDGLWGQFALGLALGLAWSPCVGPTLGAAITLASQGREIAQVALVMLFFGLGAALPMMALGLVSREAGQRLRGRLSSAGRLGKGLLGGMLLLLGLAILSGMDKAFEAWVIRFMPDWLLQLTTAL